MNAPEQHWSTRGDVPEVRHFLIGSRIGPTVKLCDDSGWKQWTDSAVIPGLPLSRSITCPACRARWVTLGGRIGR